MFCCYCRDLSLEVLKREPEGSFIVRASNSKNGLALSVRVPQDFHPEGIVHYLIIRSPKGFKIKVKICLRWVMEFLTRGYKISLILSIK